MQSVGNVRIGVLLEGQTYVEPDGFPARLTRAAIGGFHDARTAARRHHEAVVLGL